MPPACTCIGRKPFPSLFCDLSPIPAIGTEFLFRKADSFDEVAEFLVSQRCEGEPLSYSVYHRAVTVGARHSVLAEMAVSISFKLLYCRSRRKVEV